MGNTIQTILKSGDVIGKYQVIRCLGVGGMGEVHLVLHQQLNVYRALKLLRPEAVADSPVFVERFMREARIASRIQHPNIVSVMDVENDTVSGFCYIVMEYVDGSSLEAVLRNGPLSPDQAVHVISEVAKGLAAASELGLVHRDIKPSNIMISQDGQVKLSDLGIAKASGDDVGVTLTMANSVVGTPAYASPEQCRSAHDVDVRADIYSLGVTLYEMVTGLIPFDGTNAFDIIAHVINDEPTSPRRLNPNVSPELEQLILKMMAKDPERRPQNIAELQEFLKPFLASSADIPPELKKLIHEHVEREVQARTSTVITAYRKKQTWERVVTAAVLILLLIMVFSSIFRISRYRRQIRQLKAQVEHFKEYSPPPGQQSDSSQTFNRLKTAEARYRAEKRDFEARISALKNQLERQTRNYQETRDAMERQIRDLNAEIDRLKAADSRRPNAAAVPPPQVPVTTVPPPPAPVAGSPSRVSAVPPASSFQPDREEYRKKVLAAMRKLIPVRARIQSQHELRSAMERMDAAKLQAFFRQFDISFEDLSYIQSWNMFSSAMNGFPWVGPVLGAALGYNPNSRGWDTVRIHAFLSQCCRAGYRIDYLFFLRLRSGPPARDASRVPFKWNRNLLDVLEFALRQPEMIRISPNFMPAVPHKPDIVGLSFSLLAAAPDFPPWLERLVRKGVLKVDETNRSGLSLLDRAYLNFYLLKSLTPAHLQCLKNLERYGSYALLKEPDRKLIAAIRESDPEKVRRIIRQEGADPHKTYPGRGNALYIASASGINYNPELIRLLVESGSPASINGFFGRSPLAAAVEHDDADLIRFLLDHGAGLNDFQALQAACRRGNTEIAELLLKNGTSPSRSFHSTIKNGRQIRFYNNDLLFDALESKNSRIAILLLEKNVSLTQRRNGKTPLETAEQDPALREVADLIRKKLREDPAGSAAVPDTHNRKVNTKPVKVSSAHSISNPLVEFAKRSSIAIPDLSRWIKAPSPDWHVHFGQAWKEAAQRGKMILILQVDPKSFPAFLNDYPNKTYIFRNYEES